MNLSDVTLFHGSAAESVWPTLGLGDDHHDYGRGFYLTDDLLLAKEWAVCRPEERAFASMRAVDGYPIPVEYAGFNAKYNERDRLARDRMDALIAGPRNPAVKVMSTLV